MVAAGAARRSRFPGARPRAGDRGRPGGRPIRRFFDFYGWAADERGAVRWYNALGKLWLRGVARILEYSTKFHGRKLNLTRITDELIVGGSVPTRAYPRLRDLGVTAVIDLREEACDDEAALARLGIELLHLPATDRYAATQEQLERGVEWALERIERGGKIYAHCKHGVGRGPLMGLAILVARGMSASQALRLMRGQRWQAAPNDRQLAALEAFAQRWASRSSAPDRAEVVSGERGFQVTDVDPRPVWIRK